MPTKSKKSNVFRLHNDAETLPPALTKYINRINAQVRNFKRFVVIREGHDHYHFDKCIITIKDGKLVCPDEEYAPTKEEDEAITKEIANTTWPKQANTKGLNTSELRSDKYPEIDADDILFEFRDENGELNFVQQRKIVDGVKQDYPWTYWSDGNWRRMEPEGPLPLYGLEKIREAATIFIHEGAKCASLMNEEFLKDHPWKEHLLGYGIAHIGWPGGAPNPHRVDWSPIARLGKQIEVIIVADRDTGGENAVAKISRAIQHKCEALIFGETFPWNFDMAGGIVNGEKVLWPPGNETKFEECLINATWATRQVPSSDPKKKAYALREEWESEFYCVSLPSVYVHKRHPTKWFNDKEFNNAFAAYSDVKNLASLLQKSITARCDSLTYEPDRPIGKIAMKNGNGHGFNTYRPSLITPKKGDLGPWEDFMDHLIPDAKERHHVKRWIATVIACPHNRVLYGLLMISDKHGVGKDTLANILRELVGEHNTSTPSEEQLLEKYNNWAFNKRLVVIREIYQGHSFKAYNRTKDLIADPTLDIRLMHTNSFTVRNWVQVYASSNSRIALKMEGGDRRWYVPSVREEERTEKQKQAFFEWLEREGLASIMFWAHEFVKDKKNIIPTGEHPPMTERKEDVIKASMSEGQSILTDLINVLTEGAEKGEKIVINLKGLRQWLINMNLAQNPKAGYQESTESITAALRRHGLYIPKKQFQKAGNAKFRVVANFEVSETDTTTAMLEPFFKTPEDLMGKEPWA